MIKVIDNKFAFSWISLFGYPFEETTGGGVKKQRVERVKIQLKNQWEGVEEIMKREIVNYKQ